MTVSFNHIKTDFYVVLEVTPLSSYEEIHKNYRALSKKYHPDIFPDKELAETKMKEIVEAFNHLKDHETRQHYDSRRIYQVRPYNRNRSNYGKKKKGFFESLFAKKEPKNEAKGSGGKDPVENVFLMAVPLAKTRKRESVYLAKNEFSTILPLDPKNPDLHYNLGIIHYYLGEYIAAVEYFKNCNIIDPAYPDAASMASLLHEGIALEKKWLEEDAE